VGASCSTGQAPYRTSGARRRSHPAHSRSHSFVARFVSSLSVGEASRLLAPTSRPQPSNLDCHSPQNLSQRCSHRRPHNLGYSPPPETHLRNHHAAPRCQSASPHAIAGHKDIHMTLLYLNVTQQHLQREFHCARQRTASLHPIPKLPLPQTTTPERVDLPAIRNAISVVRHPLQLFRLELQDPNARRKLR
jgi:hypothetical protein